MSKPYKGFEPKWVKEAAPKDSYRSIFRWGDPDFVKYPKESLYKMMKEKFKMTDADFQQYDGSIGMEKVVLDQPSRLATEYIEALKKIVGEKYVTTEDYPRLAVAYGKTGYDAIRLRRHQIDSLPDAVVYPDTTEQVEQIVAYCTEHKIPLYVYGGGSSVTRGVEPTLGGISLDMRLRFNKVLKFKKEFVAKEVIQAKRLGISPEELLNQSLKNVPEGCEGLLFQPYFTPNITMPTARGAIIGFSDAHTRIHLYRAIIEGINFALIDGMKVMEQRAGHKFQAIYLGGGGSQSDEICQITAHMFGLPVVRTQTYEATGIGCALAAFVGIGVFESYEDGVKAMVHEKDRFEPDEKIHQVYDELYTDVYKEIYGKLSPLYKRLHEIYHRE
ncbi:MAG: FGGY-family carbohydrate kinase [Bariatricus sp.]